MVSLCKPVTHTLNILGGENLNIKNQWREPQKGGGEANFKISVGESKRGEHNFWLKFSGGKNLGGNYENLWNVSTLADK